MVSIVGCALLLAAVPDAEPETRAWALTVPLPALLPTRNWTCRSSRRWSPTGIVEAEDGRSRSAAVYVPGDVGGGVGVVDEIALPGSSDVPDTVAFELGNLARVAADAAGTTPTRAPAAPR